MKLIEAIFGIAVIIGRFVVIFRTFYLIAISSKYNSYDITPELHWLIIVMVADLYVSYIFRGPLEEKQ